MTKPRSGDRILMFKEPWLSMIIDGRKKMEVRSKPFSGKYYLGFKKRIFGMMIMGRPQHIPDTQAFQLLYRLHRVRGSLPYKKTFGLPIMQVQVIRPPISFVHPRGAVAVVRYR